MSWASSAPFRRPSMSSLRRERIRLEMARETTKASTSMKSTTPKKATGLPLCNADHVAATSDATMGLIQ
eukprot:CAMPEP_0170623074 /NCGR_PEP_ID=MMETSP0224-20130122/29490_1 /TAXON_ID=285029 /ORGANISM="Togula jolla, Strain CCCM 725" /LENGTH=68 /DNA_ID=CAMNT_0010949475 /DNA_START=406 /DNA_END=612 /DNA_ORIENTATION=+